MRRLSVDVIIARFKKTHGGTYNYDAMLFTGIADKIEIICQRHGSFWQTPYKHTKGQGCPACGGSLQLTKREFVDRAVDVHSGLYDYSLVEYVNTKTKVTIICPTHGIFPQSPEKHMNGAGCPGCNGSVKLTTEEFRARAIIRHGGLYDYRLSVYESRAIPLFIICPIHGVFTQRPADHLRGAGCMDCSGSKKTTTAGFIARARDVHGDLYDYSTVIYESAHVDIEIICRDHGIFKQRPNNHVNGQGCPSCNNNSYSKIAIKYLTQLAKTENIHIQHAGNGGEFTIPNTRYRVDGYCAKTNTVYEYHGDVWHGNPLIFSPTDKCHPFNDKTAAELYDMTIIRENLIKSLGYNLISVWENNPKNIINKST